MNRLEKITYDPNGTGIADVPDITYDYGTDPGVNENGRLISMTDGVGSESYTYDELGRVTNVTKVIDGESFPLAYDYNFAGEVESLTYPSLRQVSLQYNEVGRLESLAFAGSDIINSIAYNDANLATSYLYPTPGVTASLDYYPERLQLKSIDYSTTTESLFGLTYVYDVGTGNTGEIRRIVDDVNPGRTLDFVYDDLGRLESAESTGSAEHVKWGLSWTYDRYGNRGSQSADHGTPPTMQRTYDAGKNRVDTSAHPEYSYDASGNLTSDGSSTMAYDVAGRLTSVVNGPTTTEYAYDGHGLRVMKSSGGVPIGLDVFSGGKVIAEYAYDAGTGQYNLGAEYVYSGGSLVATRDASGSMTYQYSDHLSVRLATDSNGAVVLEQGHFPFGESWYDEFGTTKWQFTTYERDAESGLDYAMARYHGSDLGRFNRPDPIAGSPASPQSLNRYAYALNDPVNLTDPRGLAPGGPFYEHPEGGSGWSGGGRLAWGADLQRLFHPGWGIPEGGFFTGGDEPKRVSAALRLALYRKGVIGIVLTEEDFNELGLVLGDVPSGEDAPVYDPEDGDVEDCETVGGPEDIDDAFVGSTAFQVYDKVEGWGKLARSGVFQEFFSAYQAGAGDQFQWLETHHSPIFFKQDALWDPPIATDGTHFFHNHANSIGPSGHDRGSSRMKPDKVFHVYSPHGVSRYQNGKVTKCWIFSQ